MSRLEHETKQRHQECWVATATNLGFVQSSTEVRLGSGDAERAPVRTVEVFGITSSGLSLDACAPRTLPVRTSPPNRELPLPLRASTPCVEALSPLLGSCAVEPKNVELKLPVLVSTLGLSTSCAPDKISRASCPASSCGCRSRGSEKSPIDTSKARTGAHAASILPGTPSHVTWQAVKSQM